MKRSPRRGDIVFASFGMPVGGEIRKARPWLVVSPDDLNETLPTVTAVPFSTGSHPYPFRVPCAWRGTKGHVIVDQVSTLDRSRIDRIAGELPASITALVLRTLREMFDE